MSDVGRRRKVMSSGDSEKLSEDSYEENEAVKGSEEEGELNASTEGTRESEYETVEGDSETDDSNAIDEDEDDDSVIIEYEREDGDGQESAPPKEKKLDDDEDRRNPQYIPKRGTFYEHDDRTAVEDVVGNETTEKEAAERAAKEGQVNERAKKVWREHENRWSHDRYNEDEQAPKSREELVAIYGYDIRNEEGPPRARRRRRYGRGPNKYTRNWEDEDAYSKPQITVSTSRGGVSKRGGRRGGGRQSNHIESQEEFPPLKSAQSDNESSNNSINQNVSVQGTTYSNRTIGIKRNTKEERNVKTQKDAFPPLELEPQQSRSSSAAHESATNKTQNHSSNYKNNKEESSSGDYNAPLGRKLRDNRDGPVAEVDRVIGRGRSKSNRGRGGSGSGTFESGVGLAMKTRTAARSSSETRTPPGVTQHHESNKGPPHAHPFPSAAFHSTNNKVSQEEPTREFHRRTNKSNSGTHSQQSSVQQGVVSDRRQQAVVPPRMQQQHQQQDSSSSNRPKRYSSLRQRSLPESGASYQPPPHGTGYFPPGADLDTVDTSNNRPKRYSSIHQVPGTVYPSPDPAPTYFQPAGYVTPQPVYGDTPQHPQSTGTPPLQLLAAHPSAPAYAATFPTTTAQFVGPAPPRMLPPAAAPPPTYIPAPAPAPPLINYVPPPPTFTTFQGYTAVPAPPAELYHPQGGITYYNTEEQTIVPRPITQKRQRSAIPIVPPPERAPRGRGRSANSREETPPGDNLQTAEDNPAPPSPPAANFEDVETVPTNESLTSTATVA